jgi:hypothetical protein
VSRLCQQEVVRYNRENVDSVEEVAILRMPCSGGEPVKFISANCLEARLVNINFFLVSYSK